MNDKQHEFVTAILKIVFTVIFGGMTGGKLFNLALYPWHYFVGFALLAGLFFTGYFMEGRRK